MHDPHELDQVIIKELTAIDHEYATVRKTKIEEEVEKLQIDTEVLVAAEDVIVLVSRDGYLKRSSLRSFAASSDQENGLKPEDHVIFQQKVNTLDHLMIFTDHGNLIYRPVHEIPDAKWKGTGQHLSQTVGLKNDENILRVLAFKNLQATGDFL